MSEVPGVLEIRVHGVSGTSPDAMLGVGADDLQQVAGDDLTGLYRCRSGVKPYGVSVPSFVAVEAYSWGSLTSGAAGFLGWVRRAAWLTLLPFALGNVAYWARPELDKDSTTRKVTAILVRVAALLLTLLMIAAMCLLGIDLLGWQCFRGGSLVCPSLPAVLHFLDTPPWDTASRRLLIGSALPVAVLAGLWLLSRQTLARYEDVVTKQAHESQHTRDEILSRKSMWNGGDRTGRLQRLHLAGGACVVVVFGTLPLARFDGTWSAVAALAGLAAVALIVLAGFAVGLGYADGIDFPGTCHSGTQRGRGLATVVTWSAWLLLVLYGVLLGLAPGLGQDQAGPLRGHNLVVGGILLLLVLIVGWLVFASDHLWLSLLVPLCIGVFAAGAFLGAWPVMALGAAALLGVTVWLQQKRSDPRGKPRAWRGTGAAIVLGAALWVAAVFTTSTVVLAADWLNGADQSVADLQAGYRAEASPGASVAELQTMAPFLTASGPVTVESGTVTVGQDGVVTVRAGTVTAQSLARTRAYQGVNHQVPGVDLGAGWLGVGDDPITIVNSCVGDAGQVPTCDGTSGEYVASGQVIPVGDVILNADPAGRTIHLRVADVPQEPLIVPQVIVWFALSMPLWLILVGLVTAWNYGRFRRLARAAIETLAASEITEPLDRVQRAKKARFTAAFAHRAERLLGFHAFLTAFVGLAVLIGASTGAPPWQQVGWLRNAADVGLWVALGVSAGILALASRMRTSEGLRRTVGVLWDLSTFWPRVAHPLGPPCYAERVVPEVVSRIRWATGQKATVILSGHSQGSLIAVAAACQLDAASLDRLRIITYGSQLRTLYGRIFPGVLGPAVIGNLPQMRPAEFGSAAPDAPDPGTGTGSFDPGDVPDTLVARMKVDSVSPRWVNLFRRTDPIGFRVFSDVESHVDLRVSEYSPGQPGDLTPRLHTHSNYQFSRQYADVVEHWYQQPPYFPGDLGAVVNVGPLMGG